MDYKEKYNAALERAKEYHDNGGAPLILEVIFPELKGSEDGKNKRISKEITQFLKQNNGWNREWLAWLEKQGKQQGKSTLEAWKNMRLEVYQQASGNRHEPNYSDDTTKMFSLNDIDEIIEKMSEQSHNDMVEPKFKVGDWIILPLGIIAHIDSINSTDYQVTTTDGKICDFKISKQDNYHLWTINDAKDGDVLACNEEILLFKSYSVQGRISLYCWYNEQTNNFHSEGVTDTLLTTRNKVCPATKEQRELLFQKMKEAGWEMI